MMSRKTRHILATGFLFLLTTAGDASSKPRAPELLLHWNDAYQLLPISYEGVVEEVNKIFQEIGVEVRWAEVGRKEDNEAPTTRVRIILMPIESPGWSLPKHTMGVIIGNEVPRSAVYIFYPSVLQTLGYEHVTDLARSPRERARLTRALGRVAAHELVHAILPEREHDHDGLLNLKLKRQHLQQSRLRLLDETADAFIKRLAALQGMAP